MVVPPDKPALRAAILAELQAELVRQRAAAASARDEATSEESRAENKWDTHSQEAAYLAEGQSRLVREVEESLAVYAGLPLPVFPSESPAALGALIGIEGPAGLAWYLVGPRAGGLTVRVAGLDVMVVTPSSPFGRQLIGRRAGDPLPGPRPGAAQRIAHLG